MRLLAYILFLMYRSHTKLATLVIPIFLIFLLVFSAWYINALGNAAPLEKEENKPTTVQEQKSNSPQVQNLQGDFNETGNITNFDAALGETTNEWRLVYEKPGQPAVTTPLVFDSDSRCDLGSGLKPCSLVALENGMRVTIEGLDNVNEVIVLQLTAVDENESSKTDTVSWDEAQELITSCKVSQVTQDHDRNVALDLVDGSRKYTIEPNIDDIFLLIDDAIDTCGQPRMATE